MHLQDVAGHLGGVAGVASGWNGVQPLVDAHPDVGRPGEAGGELKGAPAARAGPGAMRGLGGVVGEADPPVRGDGREGLRALRASGEVLQLVEPAAQSLHVDAQSATCALML